MLGNEFVPYVISCITLFGVFTDRDYRRMACDPLSHKYILIFPALGATVGHFQSKDKHQFRGGVCFMLLCAVAVFVYATPC